YSTTCSSSLPLLVHLVAIRLPCYSTLFPYTTLFRSQRGDPIQRCSRAAREHSAGGRQGSSRGALDAQHRASHVAGGLRRVIQARSEEHTSELQSRVDLVCRLLLEKKKLQTNIKHLLN